MGKFNLTGYLLLIIVTGATPGPNSILLFNQGKSGLRDLVKLGVGMTLGFFCIIFISGFGMATWVNKYNGVRLFIKLLGSFWLAYLSYSLLHLKLVTGGSSIKENHFTKGFLMQFVNIKAWILAFTAETAFLPTFFSPTTNVLILAITYSVGLIPFIALWAAAGNFVYSFLKSERSMRLTSYVLSALMILTILTIWVD